MVHKELVKSSLWGKRPMFLQIGFVVVFLFVYMVSEPVKAQEIKSDAVTLGEGFFIDIIDGSPDSSTAKKEVFYVVEQMPEFPGGDEERIKFLSWHLNYPKEARDRGLQGVVYVGFVVEPNGELTNFEIVKSSRHTILDKEALRVAKLMPNWKPGIQDGKQVRVQFQIPITFKIIK